LALVALSVVEQRYRAVVAVLDGARVTEVAAEVEVVPWLVEPDGGPSGRVRSGCERAR